jgi:hypothetical protein
MKTRSQTRIKTCYVQTLQNSNRKRTSSALLNPSKMGSNRKPAELVLLIRRSGIPITRSMESYERKAKYDFIFDFDDSSLNWKKNKISVGNGSFEYKN